MYSVTPQHCWYVKHPIINYIPHPAAFGWSCNVVFIDDRFPRSFENENEGGAESDWLGWEACIPWFDSPLPETQLNERTNERFWTILLGELSDANWIKENNHEIHNYRGLHDVLTWFALFLVCRRVLNLRPPPSLTDMIKQPAPPPDDSPYCCLRTRLFDKHVFQKSVNYNAGQVSICGTCTK